MFFTSFDPPIEQGPLRPRSWQMHPEVLTGHPGGSSGRGVPPPNPGLQGLRPGIEVIPQRVEKSDNIRDHDPSPY